MQEEYAEIIIPLRFKNLVTYSIPPELNDKIVPGSVVQVNLGRITCNAIVKNITDKPSYDPKKIKPINDIINLPPVSAVNIEFMEKIAQYYMCATNDVLRISAPSTTKALKKVKKEKNERDEASIKAEENRATEKNGKTNENKEFEETGISLPVLTEEQQRALDEIRNNMSSGRTTLLNGISASGKTEIYIHIAAEYLLKGKNVLFLVPEIAICRQIQFRLKKVFKDRLLIYHSGKSAAVRRDVYEKVAINGRPHLILGLRSALFLPFSGLGAIIVDEEQDNSYKQTEPVPHYHGRDAALILGRLMHCPAILGSSTPSFETIFNVRKGKFAEVVLDSKYFGEGCNRVTIVDMLKERRKNAIKGSFSLILINAIKERLSRGEQCLIFRSRRAYAFSAECTECGFVPRCPKCNIPLAYHKYNNTLSCHICGYREHFSPVCPECDKGEMKLSGAGTEKIEEELEELFPEARIGRLDADVLKNSKESDAVLKRFANGETDILVGTQMIAKGFDFSNLTLTAVIKAETLASVFDFRADEKALQLLRQLKGRAGRRGNDSEMIIQTSRAGHPVFRLIMDTENNMGEELIEERRDFDYPPFVRLVKISVKSANKEELRYLADLVKNAIRDAGVYNFTGPVPSPSERYEGKYVLQFIIRLPRNRSNAETKAKLYSRLSNLSAQFCIIDVDPVNI